MAALARVPLHPRSGELAFAALVSSDLPTRRSFVSRLVGLSEFILGRIFSPRTFQCNFRKLCIFGKAFNCNTSNLLDIRHWGCGFPRCDSARANPQGNGVLNPCSSVPSVVKNLFEKCNRCGIVAAVAEGGLFFERLRTGAFER